MKKQSNFTIYNASAGSGKTFTLSLNYLSKLLLSNNIFSFRHILAITFTNKAVGEMKSRILNSLKEFSAYNIDDETSDLFKEVVKKTALQPEEVISKSKKILRFLLDHYAAFEVSTIDAFTHKVIRTFAKDLNLSINFDVELEANELLAEAVDRLINRVGFDETLTQVLIDFTIEKVNDDKSGNIKTDILETVNLILSENDLPYIEALEGFSIEDFIEVKQNLETQINEYEVQQVEVSKQILAVFNAHDVRTEFTRNSIPNFFEKIINGAKQKDLKFDETNWMKTIDDSSTYYNKKTPDKVKLTLENLSPQIVEAYNQCKLISARIRVNEKLYESITQLSVIHLVKAELELLKQEKNILLISDFNQKINNQIKDQPTPFIYERLGEKFLHYFIDEFQDTSTMQWQNLTPLVENALGTSYNQEQGTATLVGDPKQSIYAWRGGDVHQFMNLIKGKTSIPVPPETLTLGSNYRSTKTIVNFNNRFFELAKSQMSSPLIHEIYSNDKLKQIPSKNGKGLVKIKFINAKTKADEHEIYPVEVYDSITEKIKQGFKLNQICVLVRKKDEGISIANYLKSRDINVMSSETLLITANSQVQELTNFLTYLVDHENIEAKHHFLKHHFLNQSLELDFKTHKSMLQLDFKSFIKALNAIDINFNLQKFQRLGLYNAVEYCLSSLNIKGNAYVQFFLDEVFQFGENKDNDLDAFLSDWELKSSSKSISTSSGFNAVSIMTIHKSKGLEFPVVIFPFANQNYHDTSKSHLWLPLDEKFKIPFGLIKKPSNFSGLDFYKQAYQNLIYEKELDSLNLLYVALTRASKELHIFSKNESKSTTKTISNLFKNYIEVEGIQGENDVYVIGETIPETSVEEDSEQFQLQFSGQDKLEVELVDEAKQKTKNEAISYGLMLHDLLAKIYTESDITRVISTLNADHLDLDFIQQQLNTVVLHPKLAAFFSSEWQSYNERDIFSKGEVFRPDKFCIKDNEVAIIDYKTGDKSKQHEQQLKQYASIFESMNYKVSALILVYISDQIELINL
ncbi:UvrD-helicase domain-containing protein [Psychroflexus sp. ALD_RP9]|uniref:UvrD-helicase domain-containing protein n=1 Tax=Psychroflexus sp. ALD_RP9 TaxID=2777186 RepID=UPI001A8FA9DD|nr:UvrD-helicase domain-containing protein [Psychroflexus sp. ALD_RP9]QSS97863.1 UvrD-helicase domain-containing protein [Psychroflexus sp. ALD_RP9]